MPKITTELRKDIVKVPKVIRQASGIQIFWQTDPLDHFTTDIAIIRNTNADAVIAVYPLPRTLRLPKRLSRQLIFPYFRGSEEV